MIGSTQLPCEREEEMEELALGNLPVTRARDAEVHRQSCASCAEAHRLFAEERAFFTSRASFLEREFITPPLLTAPSSILGRKLPSSRDLWSVTRVAAAALACAAAIVCVFRDASTTTTTAIVESEPHAAADRAGALHASTSLPPSLHGEEGLACAYPASGISPKGRSGSLASLAPSRDVARALAFSSSDVGVCEEGSAISSGP